MYVCPTCAEAHPDHHEVGTRPDVDEPCEACGWTRPGPEERVRTLNQMAIKREPEWVAELRLMDWRE